MAFEGYVVTKILHVFFAVAWIGGLLYHQVLVQPVLAKTSPATQREVGSHMMPLTLKWGNITGGFTLLTGIGLVSMNPYGVGWGDLLTDPWGRLISFGLVGTIAILYLVNVAIRPTAKVLAEKLRELGPGQEVPAGVRFLQKRLAFSARLALIIGLIVLVAMVAANGLGLLAAG